MSLIKKSVSSKSRKKAAPASRPKGRGIAAAKTVKKLAAKKSATKPISKRQPGAKRKPKPHVRAVAKRKAPRRKVGLVRVASNQPVIATPTAARTPLRILLASSEVHPYSKTGGLADMTGAMGKTLARAGHQVGIVTPLYRGILAKFPDVRRADWYFDLPLGGKRSQAGLFTAEPVKGLTIYFVDQPGYFDRAGIYNENNWDYPDNGERFIFFSKCVAHLARYLPWQPEIVHVNDWQAGLVPLLIKHQQRAEGWGNTPHSCLTIHNLAYQGVFPKTAYDLTNLPPDYFHPDGAEFYAMLNCLKAGIAFADAITTVSPRYAREITTEEFGEGLDGFLRKQKDRLFGILNGADYDEWNPKKDAYIKHPFSEKALAGKARNKAELQKELGLDVEPDVPLFGTISRLAAQKGLDIELGALEEMLQANIQFVLLGGGQPEYERGFQKLARRYPSRVAVRLGYDHGLSHRIEAGCDFYLMPSRFEPCGLNQMYSLRYGAIPIVRVTGGLDDTVVDASENPLMANGIKFAEYSAPALAKAIRKALVIYKNPKLLRAYRLKSMAADFSWDRTVKEYEKVYDLAAKQ